MHCILFKVIKMKIYFLFFYFLVLLACKEKKQKIKAQDYVTTIVSEQYNFNKPDATWKLPSSLNEVSGIFLLNDSIMLCQEDERGRIYLFNLKKSVVERIILFGNADDYEDISFFNNVVYLINSKGTILSVTNYLQEPLLLKYNTALSQKNDVEGLSYDSVSQSFLIVCKEQQGIGIVDKNEKVIYQFQKNTGQIAEKPFLSYKEYNFKPSAIAVHPISKSIFVLSASKAKLLELARDGSTKYVYELKKSIFSQPEGLAFDKSGNLYISNEANGAAADILFFKCVKD